MALAASRSFERIQKNDLGTVECMLSTQIIALDALFNNLAERAHRAEYMSNLEVYLKLALKAQSQARCTAETLALIAGVGGWSGVYHGVSLFLDDTPNTPAKLTKIALLPLFWGSCGITSFVVLWLSFQGSLFVVGNMLRPIPFVLHMMALSGIFCAYAARKQIREVFFTTPAEAAVAEQVQDRAEADQAENEADQDNGEEEDDGEETDGEETDSEEADGQEDSEEADGGEEESDDATTITGEAHQEIVEDNGPQHTEEEVSTLVAEVDQLMTSAGPGIPTEAPAE